MYDIYMCVCELIMEAFTVSNEIEALKLSPIALHITGWI